MVFNDELEMIFYEGLCNSKRKLAFISAGKNDFGCKHRLKKCNCYHHPYNLGYRYRSCYNYPYSCQFRAEKCDSYPHNCQYRYEKCNSHPHSCHIKFLKDIGYSICETALTDYYKFKLY